MSFAQNLEYLLKENGMTRYRFSKLTGYSQTTLANWIGGKTTPYSKDRETIAQMFNLSVEELLADDLPPIRKQKETPPSEKNSGESYIDFPSTYLRLSAESRKAVDEYAQYLLSKEQS